MAIRDINQIVPWEETTKDERDALEKAAAEKASALVAEKVGGDQDVYEASAQDLGITGNEFKFTGGSAPDAPMTYINYEIPDNDVAFVLYGYDDPDRAILEVEIGNAVSTLAKYRTHPLHVYETPKAFFKKPLSFAGKGNKIIIKVKVRSAYANAPVRMPLHIKKAVIAGKEWGEKVSK